MDTTNDEPDISLPQIGSAGPFVPLAIATPVLLQTKTKNSFVYDASGKGRPSVVFPEQNTHLSVEQLGGKQLGGKGRPSVIFPEQNTQLSVEQLSVLQGQGFTAGLAQEMENTKSAYPIRFWVVDNSGSMRTSDGHRIRGGKNSVRVVSCTRWTELQGTLEYHADLAGLLRANTVFRMLNHPGANVGPQEFSIAGNDDSKGLQDSEQAKCVIRKCEPRGVTPLTQHLMVIRARIQSIEPILRGQGQRAVVVLATDGLPSNEYGVSNEKVKKDFVNALRSLQALPVWVVIRLCTDDDEVVNYYNDLDQILEFPLEVIDDFFGEGKEIYGVNGWLNYALPLHRCREMGYNHHIFDLLDERKLNKDELVEFLELLFGKVKMRDAPDVHSDWKSFSSFLSKVVKAEGKQWNPNKRKLDWWIDMKRLDRTYGGFHLFGRRRWTISG